MKAVFRLIGLVVAITAIPMAGNTHAEENCNDWQTAETSPANSKFQLELRTCDLTYGLSAYVQIKNPGDNRLSITYRITTKDDKYRDSDIILEPASTARAGNCQACAKRYAGFKSWQLLSVKILAKAPAAKTESPVTENTAPAPVPATAPATVQPITTTPGVTTTQTSDKVVESAKVPETTPTQVIPAQAPVATSPPAPDKANETPKENEKKIDVFRTEDGTEIPYDQLPPEFRKRK